MLRTSSLRPFLRFASSLFFAALVALVCSARAQPKGASSNVDPRARGLFELGAKSYKNGDFVTAARYFKKAYDVQPRPGLLFSAGQAMRREYQAKADPVKARTAIKYYREYVKIQGKGGRVLDATKAISELVNAVGEGQGVDLSNLPARISITSPTPGAVVQLDDGDVYEIPLSQEIAPGPHKVKVMASGYASAERNIVAAKGDIVPLDLPLTGLPPLLTVSGVSEAEVVIDGKSVGTAPFAEAIAVEPGEHFVTVRRSGRKPYGDELAFETGSTTDIDLKLPMTNQRKAAWGV
ncbi:MAG: PEGA domain-containing protein, partial [Myxococcota bacterium]